MQKEGSGSKTVQGETVTNCVRLADIGFDVAIGNPPYNKIQNATNHEQMSIYPYVINEAKERAKTAIFIFPGRCLSGAGRKKIAKWGGEQTKSPHFSLLKFYENPKACPLPIDIPGGLAIGKWSKLKTGKPIGEIYIRHPLLSSALAKVRAFKEETVTSHIALPRYNRFSKEARKYIPSIPAVMSSPSFKRWDGVAFFRERPKDGREYIQILGLDAKAKRAYRFIRRDWVMPTLNLAKWKVFVPKANSSGALGETLSTPLIGQPLIGHTETFLSIGSFDTEPEAEACLKYVKSKFARAMLGILKVTQHNPKDTWKYVPWQDFTPSSDIDWTQSIPDIDRQLYKKYGLDENEIAFIENNVKEME